MRASSEAVEGNKVRLSVEVDEPEVDKVLDDAVRTLSRQARVPGFRPGKVPRQVLEARMGGAMALRAEALREAIPDFYAQALADAQIDPISAPQIDITAGEETGALSFDALVEVRPSVAIPGYAGLAVTVPSPLVTDADVDAQIDRLRETDAELVEVQRAARDGDHVTLDLHGTDTSGREVAASDDFLYEVGSGRGMPELDEQLRGAKVGDVLAFTAGTGGPGAGAEAGEAGHGGQSGQGVAFRVLVKEVKEKKLPDVTDEWAADASEFSSVQELRDDLRRRIGEVKRLQSRLALQRATVAGLAELVEDEDVPEALVEEELRQRLSDLSQRLEDQRISIQQLLEATGRSEESLLSELRGEAREAVKADLALRALADAEGLEVSDDELDAELERMAQRLELDRDVVRERLTRAGRIAAVRSEQRKEKALAWLLEHVEVVDENGEAVPRDQLEEDAGAVEGGPDVDSSAEPADVTNGDAPA